MMKALLALIALATAAAAAPLTVPQLEALPLARRQTADYHHALARACRAASLPGPAAEALATAGILPPGQRVDQASLRAWLEDQGRIAWAHGHAALEKGDKAAAAKAAITALKCNPVLATREDPLKKLAFDTLAERLRARPDLVELHAQRGFLLWIAGDRTEAQRAFLAHAAGEKDAYRAWRSTAWAGRMKDELDAAHVMAGPAPATSPAVRPSVTLSGAAPPPSYTDTSVDPKVRSAENQLRSLDARIRSLESPGRWATITEGGKRRAVSGNDSRVTTELEELRRQRDALARSSGVDTSSAPVDSGPRAPSNDPQTRIYEIDNRLSAIEREEKELGGNGYYYFKEDGKWKKVSGRDPRAQEKRDALAAERASLENERATTAQKVANPPSRESYDAPPPPPLPVESAPAPEASAEKANMAQEIERMDSEIQRLENAGRESQYVPDANGTKRWMKPSDSRYQTYLEDLKEKRRQKQSELDRAP